MVSLRRFDADIEALAAECRETAVMSPSSSWALPEEAKHTRYWTSDAQGHEALAKIVGCGSMQFDRYGREIYGEGSPRQNEALAAEKIVADIAYDLELPVTPGVLWQPYEDQPERIWYLSMKPEGRGTIADFPNKPSTLNSDFLGAGLDTKDILQDPTIAAQSTALWVLAAYVGDLYEHANRSDNHIICKNSDGDVSLCGIDYGGASFHHSGASLPGDYVGPVDPQGKVRLNSRRGASVENTPESFAPAVIDKAVALEVLERIKQHSPDALREIVERIPDTLIGDDNKEAIIEGLAESVDKTDRFINRMIEKWERFYPERVIDRAAGNVTDIETRDAEITI